MLAIDVLNILDFLHPIRTVEAFETDDWLADLPQRTWPQAAGRSSDIILLKSTAAISVAAMFVGDRTTASTPLAGAAAVVLADFTSLSTYQGREMIPLYTMLRDMILFFF